ncbi:MAG: GDP-mannose 4,6-dehydratase [Candidatus Marinimicrobia bacterium]|nr:GDP-mannose 4,6-dehydratase [Candidatus Neomarinimicrobiota bacterium]
MGGNSEWTNLQLLAALFGALRKNSDLIAENTSYDPNRDYESLITFVPDRTGHDKRYAVDTGMIKRELGWQPSRSLAQGLRETVAWYVTHLDWCETVLKDYDRTRLGMK